MLSSPSLCLRLYAHDDVPNVPCVRSVHRHTFRNTQTSLARVDAHVVGSSSMFVHLCRVFGPMILRRRCTCRPNRQPLPSRCASAAPEPPATWPGQGPSPYSHRAALAASRTYTRPRPRPAVELAHLHRRSGAQVRWSERAAYFLFVRDRTPYSGDATQCPRWAAQAAELCRTLRILLLPPSDETRFKRELRGREPAAMDVAKHCSQMEAPGSAGLSHQATRWAHQTRRTL
jgi:hypothetical protein